jgi:hypothetical protein
MLSIQAMHNRRVRMAFGAPGNVARGSISTPPTGAFLGSTRHYHKSDVTIQIGRLLESLGA